MKTSKIYLLSATLATALIVMSCATAPTQSADVKESLKRSLDLANLKDVTVAQDRTKGVVTLGGHVAAESDKTQAASIAKSIAGEQVVANEIAVVPPDNAADAKQFNSALDDGIESNLKAALISRKLQDIVKFNVKNNVVTLSGEVVSQQIRKQTETLASEVPNVKQVVNELQVKGQKATSSN
ncbi:MAG: BON domain-containing protein [Acidobacteria bacterium]|nr:BON domain-containing protein [Acidobacteriota bacterium]